MINIPVGLWKTKKASNVGKEPGKVYGQGDLLSEEKLFSEILKI